MSNRTCSKCGEEYSDTYRKCPFCEEEAAIRRGKPIRRRGGKRLSKRKRNAGAGSVMMTVMAVVIVGVMGYVFYGEQVADFMGFRPEQNDQLDPAPMSVRGDDPAATPAETEGDTDPATDAPVEPAGPLTLDHETFTIPSGETARLTAAGGAGEILWASSNENIATVADGAVTGVAGGTVTITATAGEETVSCAVTVTGEPWVNPIQWTLNKEDFTFYASDPDVQMKVKDCTSPIVWASENTNVVTISETGLVKWVGKGTTNVTATVDGQVLTCIVRCK